MRVALNAQSLEQAFRKRARKRELRSAMTLCFLRALIAGRDISKFKSADQHGKCAPPARAGLLGSAEK